MTRPAMAFSPTTVRWLVGVGTVAFIAMCAVLIFGDDQRLQRTVTGNSFSDSALGHRAFLEVLENVGFNTVVSRSTNSDRPSNRGLLVLAEPRSAATLREALLRTQDWPSILVVLPKRHGSSERAPHNWIDTHNLLSVDRVQSVLSVVDPDARIERGAEAPKGLVLQDTQLVRSKTLRPVLATGELVLAGRLERGYQKIYLLADPDLIANHGLDDGGNARAAVAIVAGAALDGPVVFDEVLHGFVRNPDLWRMLFSPPFVFASLHALAMIAFAAWAGAVRFGPILPTRPRQAAGRRSLIDASTRLLRPSAHGRGVLRRYADLVLRDVAARLHAPVGVDGRQLSAWLAGIGGGRVSDQPYRDVIDGLERPGDRQAGTNAGVTAAAQRLYRWKRELLDGS